MVLFRASNIERPIYSPLAQRYMCDSIEFENLTQALVQGGTKWVTRV